MWTSLRSGSIGMALASCVLASASAQGPDDHPAAGLTVPPSSLSDSEQARAVAVAEPQAAISSASALHPDAVHARNSANRVVVTDVQAVGIGKDDQRLAVVTLYQYEGNLTVTRLVDLNTGRVIEEDRIQDGGARFTNVEQDYARQLLLADDRVQRLIASLDGVTFQFLLTVTPDPTNPLYGKRVVNVLINTSEGYITEVPMISVNLTDAAVIVGPQP